MRFGPWALVITGMNTGAALFAAGAVFFEKSKFPNGEGPSRRGTVSPSLRRRETAICARSGYASARATDGVRPSDRGLRTEID
jgi:hypothetical protein